MDLRMCPLLLSQARHESTQALTSDWPFGREDEHTHLSQRTWGWGKIEIMQILDNNTLCSPAIIWLDDLETSALCRLYIKYIQYFSSGLRQ